ncbi:Fe(II)/alpha-ketoglutarate-dependent arginine beta-hydroxylase [Lipingzhangella halophila]|uniref:Fe(II)/alpha-ketoglutarate-dependent arginine beta-hydroxylase n=1 Tax=Lipingzhangella halophila TaxID=1783352 RepID=A0A7W7RLI9_9ACTN|nr:TauD/TfdA family dioxygenase [Lipingzhangella halophila]MBB4933758.1 Fe(II)/alpha-ketoglutarate-dependent arginine beta-hydroxylase [Lipingzhangella halophila]
MTSVSRCQGPGQCGTVTCLFASRKNNVTLRNILFSVVSALGCPRPAWADPLRRMMGIDSEKILHGELTLTEKESRHIGDLSLKVAKRHSSMSAGSFFTETREMARDIPQRVQDFLVEFKRGARFDYCVIRGHLVDDDRIGKTPADWRYRPRPNREFPEEIPLLFYSHLIGEPFTWPTQQNGNLVNDVFPIRGYEQERLGNGSKLPLTFHTEDAFHSGRADYLVLASLRNPNSVPLVVSRPDPGELSEQDLDLLFKENFRIIPDDSHLPENNADESGHPDRNFEDIEKRFRDRESTAVLFGSRERPLLRFDASHMEPRGDDSVRAFRAMHESMEKNQVECALDVGDHVILNNHRVAHKRNSFVARYDGTDRWLKRINIRAA